MLSTDVSGVHQPLQNTPEASSHRRSAGPWWAHQDIECGPWHPAGTARGQLHPLRALAAGRRGGGLLYPIAGPRHWGAELSAIFFGTGAKNSQGLLAVMSSTSAMLLPLWRTQGLPVIALAAWHPRRGHIRRTGSASRSSACRRRSRPRGSRGTALGHSPRPWRPGEQGAYLVEHRPV